MDLCYIPLDSDIIKPGRIIQQQIFLKIQDLEFGDDSELFKDEVFQITHCGRRINKESGVCALKLQIDGVFWFFHDVIIYILVGKQR